MNDILQQVAASADREIITTRVFNAPRALVFKAWTDPQHLAQWWGPRGYSSPGCEIDLRVGGVFRVQMQGPDGSIYPCEGIYREIVEPERLVLAGPANGHACGGGLPPNAVITVTFAEEGNRTRLTIHTHLASAADRAAAVEAGFTAGWADTLQRLAEIVEQE